MQSVKIVHWQEGGSWLGYLQDYPDYWTQGDTLDDLKENLEALYLDIASGDLAGIRKVDEAHPLASSASHRSSASISSSSISA